MRKLWRRTPPEPPLEAAAAPLDSAAALVERGELLAAIELLTEANRRARDVRIEEQLLELRYQAYAKGPRPSEPPFQPEAVTDMFPGAIVPEIDAALLTVDAVRSAILCHGSLIVRGLLQPDRVRSLVDDIDAVFDGYDRFRERGKVDEDPEWFKPFKYEPKLKERHFRRQAGGVLAVDSPRALFNVIEAFDESAVGNVVREYFDEPPALLAKKWTLRRTPHDAGPSDWHQDGAFMGQGIRSLDVWVALSHCGDTAPGIDIVGRRLDEIVERGTEGAWLEWTVGPGVVERVARGNVVRPVFEAGDAVLFDHMNLHRTATDPSFTHDRYAIEAWFFAPSTYGAMTNIYDDGDTKKIPADQIPIVY
ncbi:MAG TPA: phytanoyl-CoA dioxygenase family protein [Acidimicrobiia bacterium]|nr:phytanoyl-CoA dioxygenase family protein [Acidimicrobiia bacterium]